MRLDHSLMRPYRDDHRRLLRRPGRKLSWQAAFAPLAGMDFAFRLNYVGPRSDLDRVAFTRKTVGGYTLAHLSARKEIFAGVDFFARANNLFNKRHEPVDGFAGRGIEFHAGLSFDL